MHIPVSVPNATVGCDICLEGPNQIKALAVESTLHTVHRTVVSVVNTIGGPIKLQQGVFLSRALVFIEQVMQNPWNYRMLALVQLIILPPLIKTTQDLSLDPHVKVVDYPELKPFLLSLLNKYRDVITLPGEPLGATDKTEHHIKLKPNTLPVYIPDYRLPYSKRQIVDQQVKHMLARGVIQHSQSPWDSPLFLVPKRDEKYRPAIDFRKANEVTE